MQTVSLPCTVQRCSSHAHLVTQGGLFQCRDWPSRVQIREHDCTISPTGVPRVLAQEKSHLPVSRRYALQPAAAGV